MKINDFFKNEKARKNVFTERNGNNNNHPESAGRRFLTEKLRLCSRNTVKHNRKQAGQCPPSSTIIFIKKQQHSTTTTARAAATSAAATASNQQPTTKNKKQTTNVQQTTDSR